MKAFGFDFGEDFGADGLDLGHDMVGLMFLDRTAQRIAVEHRKHFIGVGDLHCRRAVIAVARDDAATEPLRRNDEFASEFARTKQQNGGGWGHDKLSIEVGRKIRDAARRGLRHINFIIKVRQRMTLKDV